MDVTENISPILHKHLNTKTQSTIMYLTYFLLYMKIFFMGRLSDEEKEQQKEHLQTNFKEFQYFLKHFIQVAVKFCNLPNAMEFVLENHFKSLYEIGEKMNAFRSQAEFQICYDKMFSFFKKLFVNIPHMRNVQNFDPDITISEYYNWTGKPSAYLWVWLHYTCAQNELLSRQSYLNSLLHVIFNLENMIGCGICYHHYKASKNILLYDLLCGTPLDVTLVKMHLYIEKLATSTKMISDENNKTTEDNNNDDNNEIKVPETFFNENYLKYLCFTYWKREDCKLKIDKCTLFYKK